MRECPGEVDQLLLAGREPGAALFELLVEAMRQRFDEVAQVDLVSGLLDALPGDR